MNFWPFFCFFGLGLAITLSGWYVSGGLPWGVDDGVKRLMARSLVSTGGQSLDLATMLPRDHQSSFFPIPAPFAGGDSRGYYGVFPALFPLLGGALYSLLGSLAFYLLPALSLVTLLFLCRRVLRFPVWALLILFFSQLFYSLTFWEHSLALICLIPLVQALAGSTWEDKKWIARGLACAMAVYIRPETALLLPPLALMFLCTGRSQRWKISGRFVVGLALGLLVAILVERIWNDRWIPDQIGENLELAWSGLFQAKRLSAISAFLFNSPIPWEVNAVLLTILAISTLPFRRPWLLVFGAVALSAFSLLWGWLQEPAFTLSGHSQGLFFAAPWAIISLAYFPVRNWHKEPIFLIAWGSLLLLYLLGPPRTGIHWGPRLAFPALLFLLAYTVKWTATLPKPQVRRMIIAVVLVALFNGAASVAALVQRGSSSREILKDLQASEFSTLIVDRWHAGADLEPLWGKMNLLWAAGPGNFERILISIHEAGFSENLGWLKQENGWGAENLPVTLKRRKPLPHTGGWKGELLALELANSNDQRWGTLFWHEGRRQAEYNHLPEALDYLRRASPYLRNDPDLHYDLSLALGRLGWEKEALTELRETLRLNPQHPQALRLWQRIAAR